MPSPLRSTTKSLRLALVVPIAAASVISVGGPALASSGDSGPKIATFNRPIPHRSHITRTDESQRVAGLNHNGTLRSTHDILKRPPGGVLGTFLAAGSSYVKVPLFEFSARYVDSDAKVAWLGFRPYNATVVRMTETWSNNGAKVALNTSVGTSGVSGGATFSTSGGNATNVTTVAKTWRIHSYTDVVSFRAMDIYRVTHAVVGKFRFGSDAYTVTTSASKLV